MLKGQLGCAGCLGGLEVASVPAHGGNMSLPARWVRNSCSILGVALTPGALPPLRCPLVPCPRTLVLRSLHPLPHTGL